VFGHVNAVAYYKKQLRVPLSWLASVWILFLEAQGMVSSRWSLLTPHSSLVRHPKCQRRTDTWLKPHPPSANMQKWQRSWEYHQWHNRRLNRREPGKQRWEQKNGDKTSGIADGTSHSYTHSPSRPSLSIAFRILVRMPYDLISKSFTRLSWLRVGKTSPLTSFASCPKYH